MKKSEQAGIQTENMRIPQSDTESVANTVMTTIPKVKTIQDAFREIGETFLRLSKEISPIRKSVLPEKKAVDIADVRDALRDLSINGRTKKMRDLLAECGAKRLSDVKPERYEELLKAAKDAMN